MCDLPHRRRLDSGLHGRGAEQNREIGTIIQEFLHAATAGYLTKTCPTEQHPPDRATILQPLPKSTTIQLNFHCETRGIATLDGRDSVLKDTKPKGFIP
jgi:hypothetical protein